MLTDRDKHLQDDPMQAAIDGVSFVANHFRQQTEDEIVKQDWMYIAQVLDRLFLWIFSLICFSGTVLIILSAPSFYHYRLPIA